MHPRSVVILVASCALTLACGGRTALQQQQSPLTACAVTPPKCVRPATDPCGAPVLVKAVCDEARQAWRCPDGSRVYARAASSPGVCRPFRDQPGLASLEGTLARVPTDDGRCLWIGEDVSWSDGSSARNVAFETDPEASFGACPSRSGVAPAPVVTIEGAADPSLLVQIDGGYRLGGKTHVVYRLFRRDPKAGFGVDELGGGVARWDAAKQRVVVPAPGTYPWSLALDLGDAMVVQGDSAFVFGCGGKPQFLTEACDLARLDASDNVSVVAENVFDSGPWVSSVVTRAGGGFEHVFAVGFGTDLETHTAAHLAGPWTAGAALGACELPKADAAAFCAAPVVHEEIADPTRPGELPITYGVGSTGTRTGVPDDYWTRLVWVR